MKIPLLPNNVGKRAEQQCHDSLNLSKHTPLYKNEQNESEILQWRLLQFKANIDYLLKRLRKFAHAYVLVKQAMIGLAMFIITNV